MQNSFRLLSMAMFATAMGLVAWAQEKPKVGNSLQEFVATRDDSFRYEIVDRREIGQSVALRLHLLSQTWKDVAWKHVAWMIVPKPLLQEAKSAADSQQAKTKTHGLLLIGGGSWSKDWGDKPPANLEPNSELLAVQVIAEATNCPAIVVSQVPFQPMLGNLHEDALIAETFKRYILRQGDDWPLLMPMVRAASRTLDMAQAVGKEEWNLDIDRFTVTGASKRGWTTWLTAGVDPRVDAIAPMVIDVLNMPAQMKHQLATWGAYSEEIGDYTGLQLQTFMGTPPGQSLLNLVDPYRYLDRIEQPKLLIFGTNDRYWPLDACNLYWDKLHGPKYLLYTPNQGHGIKDHVRLLGTVCALHRSRINQFQLPELHWESQKTADSISLKMKSDRKPVEVNLWTATSATKDFRNATWSSQVLDVDAANACATEVALPIEGYQAWFGEWKFENEPFPAFFSTNIILSGKP